MANALKIALAVVYVLIAQGDNTRKMQFDGATVAAVERMLADDKDITYEIVSKEQFDAAREDDSVDPKPDQDKLAAVLIARDESKSDEDRINALILYLGIK